VTFLREQKEQKEQKEQEEDDPEVPKQRLVFLALVET